MLGKPCSKSISSFPMKYLANVFLIAAYSSIYCWRLFPCVLPILPGPYLSAHRFQRVHTLQLLAYSRTLCPPPSCKASSHGVGCDSSHRRWIVCPVHSCPWQETLKSHFTCLFLAGGCRTSRWLVRKILDTGYLRVRTAEQD